MGHPLWKNLAVFNKDKDSLYDPAIPLLIYPREMKTQVHTKTSTQTFTAALLLTSPNWKQPKCSSLHIHPVEHCSMIERNKRLIHATVWTYLKALHWVKEIRQKRLPTVWFCFYETLENTKSQRQKADQQLLGVEKGGWWHRDGLSGYRKVYTGQHSLNCTLELGEFYCM